MSQTEPGPTAGIMRTSDHMTVWVQDYSWQLLTMAVWDHVTANNGEKTLPAVTPQAMQLMIASLYDT